MTCYTKLELRPHRVSVIVIDPAERLAVAHDSNGVVDESLQTECHAAIEGAIASLETYSQQLAICLIMK